MVASADRPEPAVPDAVLCIAQATLGDMDIGIDTRFVAHAILRPARLTRLPRSHGAIDGVFADGEHLVPLVDLRKWMNAPAGSSAPPGHVMVLHARGRTIGLAIDEARGVARVDGSRIRRVHRADADDGFFHSVAQTDDGSLLSLLDPELLMDTVQAWTQDRCGAHEGSEHPRSAPGVQARLHALARVGTETLGIRADLVVEVLRRPFHQSLLASDPQLLGMIDWRGNPVPLVDLGAALGMAPGQGQLVMIIVQDNSQVAVLIDSVIDVRPLDETGLAAVGPYRSHALLLGDTVVADGARILLVDGDALLRAFAAPGLLDAPGADPRAKRSAAAEAYAIYDAGQRWAIPMRVLEEVVRQPEDAAHARVDDTALPRTFVWRGRTLHAVDLRRQNAPGPCASSPRYCVMIARCGERHVALIVNELIEMLFVQQDDVLHFGAPGGRRVELVSVTRQDARASYPIIDLDTVCT